MDLDYGILDIAKENISQFENYLKYHSKESHNLKNRKWIREQ